ncbi:MAG: DNA polymerase II large subunit [Nanoarchaeota archaeon]|nr:DNA polymerase II large subunit [Nanoarchaeota archaeon]
MEKYFEEIEIRVKRAYDIANSAKSKGLDPDDKVKVPLAKNMAERVEGLISSVAPEIIGKGVVNRIIELEQKYQSQDWRIAFIIAEEVASEKFCKFEDKKKAIETGIRIGFSYVTVGVVSSPLEGLTGIELKKRADGKEYFCLMYSGPIRSAGGTGAAVSVLISDYVRKKLGYAVYDPTDKEIKRACTELEDYNERVTNLQYFPSKEETMFLAKNLPVQIDGDGTSDREVSNYKDLPRIESNRIRGGFCLVMAECLALKAKKLWKQLSNWGNDFSMEQWDFMQDFLKIQDQMKAKGAEKKKEEKITPDFTYIKDIVAGRPVFSHPLRNGGFRLRYGRARTSGLSSDAINPITMFVLNNYLAIGTQFKTERPGKSTILSICDQIDGPIVKLKNGNVIYLETIDEAKKVSKNVEEIIYLGDILINYGDFLNRNHKLIPAGFVEEWWIFYIEKYMKENNLDCKKLSKLITIEEVKVKELLNKPITTKINFIEALKISEKLNVPLHPRWIYFWNTLKKDDFFKLFERLKFSVIEEEKIIIPSPYEDIKRYLELIGINHQVISKEYLLIEKDDAKALLTNLGFFKKNPEDKENVLEMVNSISPVLIKDKCGTFIGARMGRPEKAKMRQLKGSPQVLFPVGEEGGRLRSFQSALDKGYIKSHFPLYYCEKCDYETIYAICEKCDSKTKKQYYCRKCDKILNKPFCEILGKFEEQMKEHGKCLTYKEKKIDINHYYELAMKQSGARDIELVKGIRGTSNEEHIPEHLMKGILRAKNKVYVNKDGTIRYDMTEMSCTHFKPKEARVSIKKLRELGYDKDCYGNELSDENQIVELKVQDIILPACEAALDEGADIVLFRVCNFIDDLLIKLYGLPKYYDLNDKNDLIGQLCVSMSPHTAAGIISRIIGFSKTQGFLAHPLLHCIMRRDCDGDEAAVMLLMDHLLNFSPKFLSNRRGSTQDAPLVLTGKLIPKEVDDMIFDMDTVWKYPLELYEAAEQYKFPSEVSLEIFKNRLDKESQYEGIGFTHDTFDFNEGVQCSAYKLLPSMREKVEGQMDIAQKTRAVDKEDVARLVIERHFMRDIKGNLRKFSMQQFRCVKCNEKFRRPPLKGRCTLCEGKIIFTISEGSVVKYLEPAENLINCYNLSPYLKQTIELTRLRIESVFGKDPEKQEALDKWFC